MLPIVIVEMDEREYLIETPVSRRRLSVSMELEESTTRLGFRPQQPTLTVALQYVTLVLYIYTHILLSQVDIYS